MKLNLLLSGPLVFTEVATAFQRAAEAAGHTAQILPDLRPKEGVNLYFVGHPGFLENPAFRFPKNSVNVLYNFEQKLPAGHERFDCIFNIFDHIRTARKPLLACPLGYSDVYEATEPPPESEPIDVFHFGLLKEGRKGEVGRRHGHLIHVVPFAWGKERDQLIQASKVNLIVKALPVYHFPVLRYLLIAAKRKFCLAEPHDSYSTVHPDRHLVLTTDLPRDIEKWLSAGRSARQEVADGIHARLVAERPYGPHVEAALGRLAQMFRC